ncbi:hypothetical protein WJX74_009704 [Apatococcus lobatus]|uniref:Membrane protein YjcL n=1 Tax=Apatococcus lobatus TaxID=904363 RepID=A0AAW1RRA2_9CHLO
MIQCRSRSTQGLSPSELCRLAAPCACASLPTRASFVTRKDKQQFVEVLGKHRSTRRLRVQTSASVTLAWPKLLPATTPWGIWAFLSLAGAAGFWSERTRVGRELSGPLVSTLVGLAFSNLGVIPASAPAVYGTVNKFLLPLAVPMLLLAADMRKVITHTGQLLAAFIVGAVGTTLGTLVAFKLVPLTSLGADGWKVASALMARHIGGAVNYVGVADSLAMGPSAQTAGLAADNLVTALHFVALFQLARHIPPDQQEEGSSVPAGGKRQPEHKQGQGGRAPSGIQVLEGATAVALSALICYVGNQWAVALNLGGASIPIITALSVVLATLIPNLLQPLVASGEGLAAIIMSLFFATVGANGSIHTVITTAPALFLFAFVQLAVHLGFVLISGRILRIPRKELLLASNANVGGPTTAAGMAAAKGWRQSLVPCILVGTLGYAVATFLAIALGVGYLRPRVAMA